MQRKNRAEPIGKAEVERPNGNVGSGKGAGVETEAAGAAEIKSILHGGSSSVLVIGAIEPPRIAAGDSHVRSQERTGLQAVSAIQNYVKFQGLIGAAVLSEPPAIDKKLRSGEEASVENVSSPNLMIHSAVKAPELDKAGVEMDAIGLNECAVSAKITELNLGGAKRPAQEIILGERGIACSWHVESLGLIAAAGLSKPALVDVVCGGLKIPIDEEA